MKSNYINSIILKKEVIFLKAVKSIIKVIVIIAILTGIIIWGAQMIINEAKKKELETHIADFGYKNVSTFIKSAINEKIARDLDNM